jgi:hypothetical protein
MNATLPHNMEIDGVAHSMHYHDGRHVIYQNVDDTPSPQQNASNAGAKCRWKLFRVINHDPGQSLGELVGSFTNLNAAIMRAGREQ